MPTFSTSIQLHNANQDDLLVLDKELKKKAFTADRSVINFVNNTIENFANAKYTKQGNLLLQDVIDGVWHAARKTGKKFTFTVVKNRNA